MAHEERKKKLIKGAYRVAELGVEFAIVCSNSAVGF